MFIYDVMQWVTRPRLMFLGRLDTHSSEAKPDAAFIARLTFVPVVYEDAAPSQLSSRLFATSAAGTSFPCFDEAAAAAFVS